MSAYVRKPPAASAQVRSSHEAPCPPAAISCRSPGPTNVPDRVLRAIDQPDHRPPRAGVRSARQGGAARHASAVFKTAHPVVIYPASGTGAWEAALVNTLSPGDRVLMSRPATSPRFGGGWRERLGLERRVHPGRLAARRRSRRRSRRACATDREHAIKAVCVVHNETSTGVRTRVPQVRQAIDRAGTRRC